MTDLEINQSAPAVVPAKDPWYATGIFLRREGIYTLEVTPPGQTWKDGDGLGDISADGKRALQLIGLYPFIRMPFEKWFALLGCIGRKRSTYFRIGSQRKDYSPPEDGELTCFANDALGFNDYWYSHNNEGEMHITVTRTA
ncbi:MAG TPA: hypothetical protein VFU15_10830 [Bacteroidia bacterium]|nr:hypothetical protein [Bacteroidia bacterium]